MGGIDLCHGRHDDPGHLGDEQPIALDQPLRTAPAVARPADRAARSGRRGRGVDVPRALGGSDPARSPQPVAPAASRTVATEPDRPSPLPPPAPIRRPPAVTPCRSFVPMRPSGPAFPFAPDGERSIARAYLKAFGRARRLVYLEDQYLWSRAAADVLAERLREEPELRLVAVVPRYPDRDGRLSGPPYRIGQQQALRAAARRRGTSRRRLRHRVAHRMADLRPRQGVHHRRCLDDGRQRQPQPAVVDQRLGALVRGDRRSARRTRAQRPGRLRRRRPSSRPRDPSAAVVRAPRSDADDHADVVDGVRGIDVLRRAAGELDDWHAGGRRGPRPSGRLRSHRPTPLRSWTAWWAEGLHRTLVDPDGRPRHLRRTGGF